MPNVGYGSNTKTKHMLPTKFRKVLIHNEKVSIEIQVFYFISRFGINLGNFTGIRNVAYAKP